LRIVSVPDLEVKQWSLANTRERETCGREGGQASAIEYRNVVDNYCAFLEYNNKNIFFAMGNMDLFVSTFHPKAM
jgi:hypothetical protein